MIKGQSGKDITVAFRSGGIFLSYGPHHDLLSPEDAGQLLVELTEAMEGSIKHRMAEVEKMNEALLKSEIAAAEAGRAVSEHEYHEDMAQQAEGERQDKATRD